MGLSLVKSEESAKVIYLVAHGDIETDQAVEICGHPDNDLSEEGFVQAELMGSWFTDSDVESIFTSPRTCTADTADVIAKHVKLPTYFKHSGLTEKKEGEWEGKTYWEIRDKYSKQWQKWSKDQINFKPEGGESVVDFVARCGRALKDILTNYSTGNRMVLVTHKDVVRAMIMNAMNIPVDNFYRLEVLPASISRVDINDNYSTLKFMGLSLETANLAAA